VPRLEALEGRTVPSFAGPTELLGVPGGTLVKVADFNNDSRPDMVTANGPNLNVAVNWSPGTYAQTFHAALGADIKDVAVGKINGDASNDIVVATGDKTVSVFLGLRDGRFGSPLKVNLPKPPNGASQYAQNVAVGDLTGDGKLDIVVGAESAAYAWLQGWYTYPKRSDMLATVLVGKGDGTFRAGGSVILDWQSDPTGRPIPIASGDVNGDGKADVVAANYGIYGYAACVGCSPPDELLGDYHVHLLTGDGKGNLQKNYALWAIGWQDSGWGVPHLAVGDLNGDGRDDIVAAYPSRLHISVSDPSTGKLVTSVFGVSGTPSAVAAGDVAGDRKLDIVVANGSGGGVQLLRGNGDGTFAAPLSFAPGSSFTAMAMADLDGDGDLDLVLLGGTSVYQILNDGVW
jgi:hypothetical protein